MIAVGGFLFMVLAAPEGEPLPDAAVIGFMVTIPGVIVTAALGATLLGLSAFSLARGSRGVGPDPGFPMAPGLSKGAERAVRLAGLLGIGYGAIGALAFVQVFFYPIQLAPVDELYVLLAMWLTASLLLVALLWFLDSFLEEFLWIAGVTLESGTGWPIAFAALEAFSAFVLMGAVARGGGLVTSAGIGFAFFVSPAAGFFIFPKVWRLGSQLVETQARLRANSLIVVLDSPRATGSLAHAGVPPKAEGVPGSTSVPVHAQVEYLTSALTRERATLAHLDQQVAAGWIQQETYDRLRQASYQRVAELERKLAELGARRTGRSTGT